MKEIYTSTTKFVLVLIVISIIAWTLLWIEISEPLKTISLMVVSFYFGQKLNVAPEVEVTKPSNEENERWL